MSLIRPIVSLVIAAVLVSSAGAAPRIGFAAKPRAETAGVSYHGARFRLDTGRLASPDPAAIVPEDLADPQRLNRNAYARGNPIATVDPDGRVVLPAILLAGTILIFTFVPGDDQIEYMSYLPGVSDVDDTHVVVTGEHLSGSPSSRLLGAVGLFWGSALAYESAGRLLRRGSEVKPRGLLPAARSVQQPAVPARKALPPALEQVRRAAGWFQSPKELEKHYARELRKARNEIELYDVAYQINPARLRLKDPGAVDLDVLRKLFRDRLKEIRHAR
jgi:RHS repeat-associated protein